MPSLPSAIRPAPPPEPPSQWERITHQLSTHKYLVGGVGLVVSAVPAYYLCKRMYPQSFTAPPARPLCNGQIRLEAVLVLGADPGSPGFGLARDLAGRKNLIVLASVSSPADGQQLERGAGGWLKALVLDPTDVCIVNRLFRKARNSTQGLFLCAPDPWHPSVCTDLELFSEHAISAQIRRRPLRQHV